MKALFQTESPTATPARPFAFHTPDVNIYETKEGYRLEAELPGVTKDNLEITLEGHELTITGRPTAEAVAGEVLFRERHGADYRRAFELDPVIDTARITARLEQGVLFLTLPKSAAVQPRKIAVSE